MQADIIFYNGIICPVVPEGITFEAVAIKDKIIHSVGNFNGMKQFIGDKTHIYDLKGKMLLPGFIDTHAHLLDTGFNNILINFIDIKSIRGVIDAIQDKVIKTERGDWIKGGNLDENLLLEKRLPTRRELDFAAPDHPVYINHRSYHSAIVNSLAIKLLGLNSGISGFEQDASGEYVSGLLTMEANTYAKNNLAKIVSDKEIEQAYLTVSKLAASVGLTTIHCIEGGEYWSDQYPDFLLKTRYKVFDPIVYFNTNDIEKIKRRNLSRMGGDLFLDGSIGNRSAALFDDYSDASGLKGVLLLKKDELIPLITEAHLNRIQLGFHAIGDRAIEEILTAFEETIPYLPNYDHRHRIEHFGIPLPNHIARAKKLGLAIATQPAFTYQKKETYLNRLGQERFLRAYPLKDLLSEGLLVGGGSDSMVSPLNPIFGIHTAVNLPNETQRLTVEEAIKLYTIWAAALAFEEKEKGTLEIGKYADMVILDKNIFSVKPEDIENIKVLVTIYHGEVVYGEL